MVNFTAPVDRSNGYTVDAADWNRMNTMIRELQAAASMSTRTALPPASGVAAGLTYYKVGDLGYVSGLAAPSSGTFSSGAYVNLGTLPAGWRPTEPTKVPLSPQGNVTTGYVEIDTAGLVRLWVNSAVATARVLCGGWEISP